MTCRRFPILLLALALAQAGGRAHGYIDLAPTLGRIVRDAQTIAIVEVEKFGRDKSAVILKKIRDLKGQTSADPIRQQLAATGQAATGQSAAGQGGAIPRPVLEWAQPGQRGVMFVSGNAALVCIGRAWYQVQSSADGWWKPGVERPDLPLAYCGHVSRLCEALELILAGKTAIVTTVPHGADEGASFDLALNRPNVLGSIRLQRIRANLRMPQVVMAVSASPAYVVGQGPVAEEEVGSLIENLKSPEPTTRAESADDLRHLGAKARAASDALAGLLNDPSPQARMSAAAAILAIDSGHARALEAIGRGLDSPDPAFRRHAARAAGLAGAAAQKAWVERLAAMLSDPDELARRGALGAIAALGPRAIAAMDAVIKLLDDPASAADAADALGRIGPAAAPAQKRLARLLDSESMSTRWAAVRGMSQIGGPDAAPAVKFMIGMLRNSSEVDGYNMMIYLGLIGPHAKDALPAIQGAWIKQPALKSAVYWAIDPERSFPWLANSRGPFGTEGDVVRFVYECYVNELGERFKPAARALAQKIADGTAGEVPLWSYRVLANSPDEALKLLVPRLAEEDLIRRETIIVALGYMGAAAAPAKEPVARALASAKNPREQRLIQWCLREMDKGK